MSMFMRLSLHIVNDKQRDEEKKRGEEGEREYAYV